MTVGILVIGVAVSPGPALAVGGLDPVVAAGIVTRNGAPVADAEVVGRLWPNMAELAAVPMDAPADVRLFHKVPTNSSGYFEINLDPATVPATHREPTGEVAIELWALADGLEINWNFSAFNWVSGQTTKWSSTAADAAGLRRPGQFTFDFGTSPSVLELDNPQAGWVDDNGQTLGLAGTVDGGATVVAAAPKQCWSAIPAGGTWDYNNREKFINVYAWSGAKAKVEQAIGASSSHTVGVAYKPKSGSWGLDGTLGKSISTSSGQSVGGIADAAVYNSINYRIWNCGDPGAPTIILGQQYRPTSWYDIFNEPYTYAPHQNFTLGCVTKSPSNDPSAPTVIRKNTTTNVTFSTGITLGPISVSARSGHNNGTETFYTVLQKSKVCGNSSQGWPNASQIDVRKY